MDTETLTFLTETGMTTIAIPVPDELTTGDLRRAWSEGASAGATAMWDALNPEAPPLPPGEFGDRPRTASFDTAVDAAAEAILAQSRGDDGSGVSRPGDVDDARRLARAVLESLGWRSTPPSTAF